MHKIVIILTVFEVKKTPGTKTSWLLPVFQHFDQTVSRHEIVIIIYIFRISNYFESQLLIAWFENKQ